MTTLDGKGETMELTEKECADLHGVSLDIHSLSRLNTSICWQQSRVQWLHDGDANSNFFFIQSCQVGGAIIRCVLLWWMVFWWKVFNLFAKQFLTILRIISR